MRGLRAGSLVAAVAVLSACGARSRPFDDAYEARPCVVVDAGALDAGGTRVDLGQPDLGGPSDAGALPGEVDVLGVWHWCGGRYEFGADGRYLVTNLQRACEIAGAYTVSGRVLTLASERDSCGSPGPARAELEVIRGPGGLVMVGANGDLTVLADDATPRQTWSVVGDLGGAPRRTTLHVVDPARGHYATACYWSTDGMCGGLFSCSGTVVGWSVTGSAFLANTYCGGGCPCVSLSQGTADGTGTVRATYTSVSCGGSVSGSFVATPSAG